MEPSGRRVIAALLMLLGFSLLGLALYTHQTAELAKLLESAIA